MVNLHYLVTMTVALALGAVDVLAANAKEAGVVFVKGTDFLIEGGQNALRLAYSGVTPDQVDEGVSRLAATYRNLSGAPA